MANKNPNQEGLKATIDKKRERRAQRCKLIKEFSEKKPDGFTVKELGVELGLSAPTLRDLLGDLMKEGLIVYASNKIGNTFVYISSSFLNDKEEAEAKEKASEKKEDTLAGREFKDSRNVTSVVAGDVSWISSRSGNGLYFRYLILVVHPYKTTCANVFPEGHEAVNVNDPNFIYIGQDPESNERLYVDLTNICQRRFSAFGERCTHIAPDRMEAVTKRLARLLKIEIPKDESETVKKLQDSLRKAAEYNQSLKSQIDMIAEEAAYTESYAIKVESEKKDLSDKYNEYVKAMELLQADYDQLKKEKANLQSLCENPQLRKDYDSLLKDRNALVEARKTDQATIDSLSKELNRLSGVENYAKGLEDEIEELKEELEAYKSDEPKIPTDVYLQAEVVRLRSLRAAEQKHNRDLMTLASALAGIKIEYVLTREEDADGEEESGEA